MEASVRDLEVVAQLRAARRASVNFATSGKLRSLFLFPSDSDECQVYLVKLLDVYPGLGKVAGRRLMADLGIGQFTRVADLSDAQRTAVLQGCGESHD
ncbi:MAG: hypothetical protein RLY19_535 [Actinomycetota bacterium]|jgi:hypothetical protein